MLNIAIIGAGNIGSRHLQGLACLDIPATIYVVDPSSTALDLSYKRFKEAVGPSRQISVEIHSAIDSIPDKIDLAIVATSSDIRASVIKQLLDKKNLSALLLEKILFDKEEDYHSISEILLKKNIPTWVNCNLRATNVFRTIREDIDPQKRLELQVEGNGWEMGCVAIHFIDLFAFFTRDVEYDVDEMDVEFFNSKRKGFLELSGTIQISNSLGTLKMLCADSNTVSHKVIIRNGNVKKELSGWGGDITIKSYKDQSVKMEQTRIPYISESSGAIAQNIIQKRQCLLPVYSESMMIHLPFIRKITEAYERKTGNKRCPLT